MSIVIAPVEDCIFDGKVGVQSKRSEGICGGGNGRGDVVEFHGGFHDGPLECLAGRDDDRVCH